MRLQRATDLMHHAGARLVKMHTPGGGMDYFIPPHGGRVKEADARTIIARPDIVGMEDSLFPGLSQTYKMVRG
jgi:hypothetical protein